MKKSFAADIMLMAKVCLVQTLRDRPTQLKTNERKKYVDADVVTTLSAHDANALRQATD